MRYCIIVEILEKGIYAVSEFAKLVGKSFRSLQRWEYDGALSAF